MYDLRMSRGASTVVNTCAGVQPGEQVLIITEHSKMSIAESLAAAAYAAGAEATLAVMTPRDLDGQEPPAAVAAGSAGFSSTGRCGSETFGWTGGCGAAEGSPQRKAEGLPIAA